MDKVTRQSTLKHPLYFERCKRIVAEARLAHEQLGEMVAQPSGVLRASLRQYLPGTVDCRIRPRLPGIRFEFDLTPRRVDLVAEPVDVAIRMGELPNSHLIARRLARLPRYLYASPRYLQLSGEPSQPADLTQHECLLLRGQANTWTLHHAAETVEVAVDGRFRLNSIGMMQRLAALDLGMAMLAEEIAAEDLANGRLRRVLPEWQATKRL